MNRHLLFLFFVCCGVASTVLDIKLEQDDNLLINAIVDSNPQYFDTLIQCMEGDSFTVVLRQHDFYDKVWTGSTVSPSSECEITETRLTDALGQTTVQKQRVSPRREKRELITLPTPTFSDISIYPAFIDTTFQSQNVSVVMKGTNWRLLTVNSFFISAENPSQTFSTNFNPLQIINSTHVMSNFTVYQGLAPGQWNLYRIAFYDYLFPYTKIYNATDFNSLGINPYVFSLSSDFSTPTLLSVQLSTNEINVTESAVNVTIVVNINGSLSGMDLSTIKVAFTSNIFLPLSIVQTERNGTIYTITITIYPGAFTANYVLNYIQGHFPSKGTVYTFSPSSIGQSQIMTVYSDRDYTPPEILSVDMNPISTGNVTLYVHVTDDMSGIQSSLTVSLSNGNNTITSASVCSLKNGTINDGFWVCPLYIGSWNINRNLSFVQLIVTDIVGNILYANCSDPLSVCYKNVTVTTPIDSIPPVLHGYRLFSQGRILPYNFIDFDISDDLSGIASIRSISNGVSFLVTPSLVNGVPLNGTFRQRISIGRLREATYYLAVIVTDKAGNVATFPLENVYVFGAGKVSNCLPDAFEYNDVVQYASPVNMSSSYYLTMCEREIDYLLIKSNESVPVTVFVQSTNALSLSISLRNNFSIVVQPGVAKTLEDINIAFNAEANVEYYVYVANTVVSYIEYNIQVGYNCSLSLEQCYPYRVDAVNCKCSVNKTEQPLLTTTGDMIQSQRVTQKGTDAATIAGSVAGSVVFVVAIVFFVLLYRRKNHNFSSAIEMTKQKPLPQQQGEIKDIVIQYPIGKGNFSQVFYGIMMGNTPVALKMLKDQEAFEEFTNESEMMKALDHKNVVHYFGTFDNKYLVTEYMPLGSLHILVQQRWESLDTNDLLDMALDAAEGMAYLVSQKIVHRDLALRNLLAADSLTPNKKFMVKISDLGLSKALEKASYYKSSSDKSMPVRWLSPEQLQFGKSSHQSDVYAFGVLLWELFSAAETPYNGLTNAEASERIIGGIHLPKIEDCPVNELMKECWNMDPKNRPSFDEIVEKLKEKKV